jgi:hypothetical protein
MYSLLHANTSIGCSCVHKVHFHHLPIMPHDVACLLWKRFGELGTSAYKTEPLTRLIKLLSERSYKHHLRYTIMSEQAEIIVQEPSNKSKSSASQGLPEPVL